MKPISLALLWKHCLQHMSPYFLMSPCELPHTQLLYKQQLKTILVHQLDEPIWLSWFASVLLPLSSEPIWLSWFARPGLWPETVLTFVFPIFITLFLDSSFLDSDLSLRSDSPETLLHWIRTNIGNLGIFLNKLLPNHDFSIVCSNWNFANAYQHRWQTNLHSWSHKLPVEQM